MSRKEDLEHHIRESYSLISKYEDILRLADDPKEQARARRVIEEQQELIKGYLADYVSLCIHLNRALAEDIVEIAVTVGVVLPPSSVQPPPHPVHAPPPTDAFVHAHALLIGVSGYRHLRRLTKATTDAQDLHDLLAQRGYPVANLSLLLDDQATKAAISDRLDWLARRAEPESTVFLFFAGHGAQRIGGFEPGEYLCPVEADWHNLRATAISDQELTTALRTIPAQRVVVLLDACHSGGVGEVRDTSLTIAPGLSAAAYERLAAGEGRVIIASCQPGEVSWELAGMRNGLFTHYLLAGLRGAAANGDGMVRVLTLFDYVSRHVPQHESQHPLLKGRTDSNFVIC